MLMQALFWCLAALLLYTFAGYPLLLRVWAAARPRPVEKAPMQVPVAIVIVGYNEEARILHKIAACQAQDYPAGLMRIVVVSDGSTDRTHELVAGLNDPRVVSMPFAQRRGKAACLVDAVSACAEDFIVFMDARQALHPAAVRCLLENFADALVGAVSGELVFLADEQSGFSQGVDAYWAYEKFIRRNEALVGSVVGVTGALYAIRRENFAAIPPQTILDDVLIPMQVVLQRRRVVFEARAIAYDRPSQEVAQERLRKIRTLAGNFQLLQLCPALVNPLKNPIFVQLVSHKLLRLAAPLAMAGLLLVNLVLLGTAWIYPLAFAAQALLYGLALTGMLLPAARRWRAVRLPTTFALLNWFVVLGFVEFISNKNAHLWKSKVA